YAEVDEWFKGGAGIIRTGWVGTSQMLCPDAKLVKSEFYSDFLRPFDVFNQCGGIIRHTGTANSAISLLRPEPSPLAGRHPVASPGSPNGCRLEPTLDLAPRDGPVAENPVISSGLTPV